MRNLWYLYPTGQGLYITLANEITPHLDRAGASFHVEATPGQIAQLAARAMLEAGGRQFVPATPGECREQAADLGLFHPDETGSYRWQAPMTRGDAAVLAVRLRNLILKGGEGG